MANYAKPAYTRGRVDWAGRMLASKNLVTGPDWDTALAIISNWRSSHSYPLLVARMALESRARNVDSKRLVAFRTGVLRR